MIFEEFEKWKKILELLVFRKSSKTKKFIVSIANCFSIKKLQYVAHVTLFETIHTINAVWLPVVKMSTTFFLHRVSFC